MKVADEDLERALRNWGRWKNGGGGVTSSFPLTDVVSDRDPWAAPPPPIINGEAIELDEVIEGLPGRYQEVIRVRYALELPFEAAVRRCRCAIQTYYDRLEKAWSLIRAERAARREKARARASASMAAINAARNYRCAT